MLTDVLFEYFQNNLVIDNSAYSVCYKLNSDKKDFIGNTHTYYIDAFLLLKTNEINFVEISKYIKNDIEGMNKKTKYRIVCNWLICSDQGGIYLYEAIAIKENRRINNMINNFMVLNGMDGTISFGPGHIKNFEYSKIMNYLLENERAIPKISWRNEVYKVIDYGFDIIKRS
jgi:hypothetical protein